MNKQEVIRELVKVEKAGIELKDCRLGYSAALVLYGVIDECNDIDLELGHLSFLQYIMKANNIDNNNMNKIHFNNYVDLFDKSDMNEFYSKLFLTKQFRSDNGDKIDLCLYTLEDILKEYLRRNRDKDKEKILKIKRFLEDKIGGRLSWIR